jgi:hypothetical protein
MMKKIFSMMLLVMAIAFSSFTSNKMAYVLKKASLLIEHIDVDLTLCNKCAEEWVHLTGDYQVITLFQINKHHVFGTVHTNTQNVLEVGLSTGNQYRDMKTINIPFSGSLSNGSYTRIESW